ncbi:MAG: DUF4303 domain-containing protein [Myxococcales bacterium]|nr:DUF4303 domain-containing protein [Myxococcales bacterium]
MPQPPWPAWLDPPPSFSREELYVTLRYATRAAWHAILREHELETFYVFGLLLSEDELTLSAVAASKQGLRKLPSATPVSQDSSEEVMHRQRWLDGEWPYQEREAFAEVNRCLEELRQGFDRHLDARQSSSEFDRRWDSEWAPLMVELRALYGEVLRDLDAHGGFVMQPSRVMLGVFSSDVELTKRSIKRLNPAHQAERVFRDMKRGRQLRRRLG